MQGLINTSHYTLYTPEEAENKAESLNLDEMEEDAEDRLEYVAKHDPTGNGLSYIEVYDHYTGELIGKF